MSDKISELTKVNEINIGQFLKSKEKQFQAALPKHLNVDRLLRIALTEITKTPKLKLCTVSSLLGAILQCSQFGLEPGNGLGLAYLIPYENRKKNIYTCQFMLGYRGMIDLAMRSGDILSISAHPVYKQDHFKQQRGLIEILEHVPNLDGTFENKDIICAYAVAHSKEGGHAFEVMPIKKIEETRKRSRAANDGPWVTDYADMCRKTPIRKLFKFLRVSIELREALEKDYQAENGEQENKFTIDGVFETVETQSEPIKKSDAVANKMESMKTQEQAANEAEIEKFREELGEVV